MLFKLINWMLSATRPSEELLDYLTQQGLSHYYPLLDRTIFHWQHASQWLKMMQTMASRTNLHFNYLAYRSLHNAIGNMGKNFVRVKIKYWVRYISDDSFNACVVPDDDKEWADQIIELLNICQYHHELNILDHSEIQQILEYLCNYWIYAVSDLEYALHVRCVHCMSVCIMYLLLYSFLCVLI